MVMTGIPAFARLGRTIVVVTVLLLAPAACGGGDPAGGDDATTAPPSTVASTTLTPPTTDGGGDRTTTTTTQELPSGSQVDQAVADLAGRLDIDEGAVTVVSHEDVTWPDGSTGCPQPGMAYTQALVDGTRIILEVDGETYSYHASGMDDPFLCEDPQPPIAES